MRHRSWFMTICSLIFVTSVAIAEERSARARDAWEYRLEERLELRFDPGARAKRVSEYGAKWGHPTSPSTIDRIDGQEHPELFLPHELFDSLIVDLERSAEGAKRRMWDNGLTKSGFDVATFWDDLGAISDRYIASRRQLDRLRERLAVASGGRRDQILKEGELLMTAICRNRIDALEAARAHFGAAKFDRLLHGYIAPRSGMSIPASPNYETELRALAGGCR